MASAALEATPGATILGARKSCASRRLCGAVSGTPSLPMAHSLAEYDLSALSYHLLLEVGAAVARVWSRAISPTCCSAPTPAPPPWCAICSSEA